MVIIARGAEAIITQEGNTLTKTRIRKEYREEALDTTLRRLRTRKEAKLLKKLNELGLRTPQVLAVDETTMSITLEFIAKTTLSDALLANNSHKQAYATQLGEQLQLLHKNDIVHGDLTTANILIKEEQVYLIDFGLSTTTAKDEDKAVDLHVLKHSLEAQHSTVAEFFWNCVLEAYTQHNPAAKSVLKRLEKVEGRGRNKGK